MLKTVHKILVSLFIAHLCLSCTFLTKEVKQKEYPSTCIWKGSIDEGFWICLEERDSSVFKFKIYADYNDELAVEAFFDASKGCEEVIQLSDSLLLDNIFVFEDDRILFPYSTCVLVPRKPIIDGFLKGFLM